MFRTLAALGLLGSLALLGATGCSSKSSSSGGTSSGSDTVDCPSANGCTACTGPTTASTATVSFATDVQPILQISCGTGGNTCHGAFGNSSQNLYLAEPKSNDDGYGDAGAILQAIVGKSSLEAPSMNIITAGDPDNSLLMHKVDGDMCAIMSECAPITASLPTTETTPCGVQMPQNSGALPADSRTVLWQWIAEGALNN